MDPARVSGDPGRIGGSRSAPTLSTLVPARTFVGRFARGAVRQRGDQSPEELLADEAELLVPVDEPEPESDVDAEDEPVFDPLVEESDDEPDVAAPLVPDDALPRLSVLKNPEPLNVTPTGVKTFLTGRT